MQEGTCKAHLEYNRLVGTKTPLNDIFLRTKSNIDEKEKKNIKFTFKIP